MGVIGENVSVTFNIPQSLLNTQNLRWTNYLNIGIGIYNTSSQDFLRIFNNERYTLVEGFEENTFDISIDFAQENDTGTHNIYIVDGFQQACLIFRLYLTIYNTVPSCNALLYHTTGKVELSCRWMQIDKGDYAEIVAGNSVLSTDEPGFKEMCNVFSRITNTFSVYVTMENLLARNNFPFKCLVFHRQKNVNQTCDLPSMMQHTIWNKQTEQLVFEHCIPSEYISLTWWYSVDGQLIPFEFAKKHTLSNIHHIVFFYGEEDDHSNVILHSMDKLNLWDYRFNNISFLAESSKNTQRQAHSKDNLQCEHLTVTVNVTALTMSSTSTSTRHSASFSTSMATNTVTYSKTCNADGEKRDWVSMAAGVASALGFIIGICFTKLYGMFRERYKTLVLRRSLQTALAVDNTGTLEMATILTQTSQPGEASLPHGAVLNQRLVDRSPIDDPQLDFLHSGRRSESSLPPSQSIVKKKGNLTSHFTNNCSSANFLSSELRGKSRRIHEKSEGTRHHDKGSLETYAPSPAVGSGPSLEITYYSLDDIDFATSKTEMADLPSSSTPMQPTLRFNGHKDCKSPYSSSKWTPSSMKPTDALEDVSVKPMVDVEALYAKPDMSRKTRKLNRSAAIRGVTKQHDLGDRAARDEDWKHTKAAMNQTNRAAENNVDSDVLIDGPIYDNSASILNLVYEFPGEDDLYVNSSGSQYNT